MLRLSDLDLSVLSPMMRQYVEVKTKYPRHIVFFRLGDFYEMFFEDAILASKELELTLTGRDCGLEERAPMCGVPYHACDIYLKRLIEKGFMVAICEQTEDPALAKGIVTRDVIRVVTPGTLTESTMLDESSNNYLCTIYGKDKVYSLCFADMSTGEVHLFSFSGKNAKGDIINELSRFSPVEVLTNLSDKALGEISLFVTDKLHAFVQKLPEEMFSVSKNTESVLKQFSADNFKQIGVDENTAEASCVCCTFAYIEDTQKTAAGRFSSIIRHDTEPLMSLGFTARRNLELVETLRNKEKKGSLLWVLDYTKTSMGRRMLKACIEQPLINPVKIMARLDAVESFVNNSVLLDRLKENLSGVYDIERLMTRVVYKSANPRDIKSLSQSVMCLPKIKECLCEFDCALIREQNENIYPCEEISNLIENAIVDEPPVSAKDGGVIKEGFNDELDSLRSIVTNGREILDSIAQKEREKTGIKKLKIGYNRVFGYYIEVTKSFIGNVPDYYVRKQTLANCERYVTEELKDAENMIVGASDKVIKLEQDIFSEVRDYIATFLDKVQKTASAIAFTDVLCSFATASVNNGYTKPEISVDGVINIKNGRHPVVELMQTDEMFVPNDAYLDLTDNRMCVITGPNMSGKSTFMRQVALITLMAQIGCFVPCDYAKISVVDQIFTRVGASDDLTSGQSTFMVEMSEVADIVSHATKNSLVILDEVGRGTSTSDGLSIAQAVAEYLARSPRLGCKTLFATHYHELIELEGTVPGVKNLSVAVKQTGGGIRFLRKIVSGGADESYGIEVAKLAGLPSAIINRANELLEQFEKSGNEPQKHYESTEQISFGMMNEKKAAEILRRTNLDEISDEELRPFVSNLLKYIN